MNELCLKSVPEIMDGRNFFVPAYQRGYRWSEKQMTDLLDDLYEFAVTPKNGKEDGIPKFYCLQPLIVRKLTDQEILASLRASGQPELSPETTWEVVDGQQRLTSLYILFRQLFAKGRLSPEELREMGIPLYNLYYETRPETADFLQKLSDKTASAKACVNIDFHFISNAYKCIDTWLKERAPAIASRHGQNPYARDILDTLAKLLRTSSAATGEDSGSVRFIWYELASDSSKDPIEEFLEINTGKIPLTEAELIKALFLQKRNFTREQEKGQPKDSQGWEQEEQLKIALQWEQMENALQQNDFWHLLSSSEESDNRMQLLFELRYFEEHPDGKLEDGNLFRYYYDKFQKNDCGKDVNDEWELIFQIFDILGEWYEDPELYNMVGYLVHAGMERVPAGMELKRIFSLRDRIRPDEPRSRFGQLLRDEIANRLPPKGEVVAGKLNLSYADKKKVRNLMLFLDIFQLNKQISALREKDPLFRSPIYKFPFDLYVSQAWDVEHIDSVTKNPLKDVSQKEEYLRQTMQALNMSVNASVEQLFDEKKYDEIWDKVYKKSQENADDPELRDRPGNLVLLDAATNRSYGNNIFAMKRAEINKVITSGRFVPICTRLVFNKSFENQKVNLAEWSDNDKKAWEKFMLAELARFYEGASTPAR